MITSHSPTSSPSRLSPAQAPPGPGVGGRTSWRAQFALALGALLIVQALGGGVVKLASGRTDDLAHTALHLVWGVAGVVAARRGADAGGRAFAAAFGAFYLALAALGWVGSPIAAALHLAEADHVFHTVVGTVSATVAAWPRRIPAPVAGTAP